MIMVQNEITKVKKRDGQIVEFDPTRISEAIFKALTATGQGDGNRAKKLSKRVVQILNLRFKKEKIPHVEQIQDIIEEVLILEGLVETAKAYILYREQRRRIREAVRATEEAVERVDQYLEQLDWEVKENANMAFSLQGLNHYVTSHVVRKYWLNKIYPKEIREAHQSGDLHLDKLDTLGVYCSGWDLYDLLLRGFGGVAGKLSSKPPKHLESALGQAVNFIFTLAGEVAGAVSFSNFDTLLAPFIRYDRLSYPQVKQALQEFLFNMATPTRVGFQCISEDTEILTPEGWKKHDEIKEGDEIKTLNLQTKEIENKKVKFIFRRKYKGKMYRLMNRIQDQLVSPQHRVLRKKFNTQRYVLEPIEDVLKLKSPIIVPIAGKNQNPDAKISDEQIKLMAWIISEGSVERPGKYRCCHRVSIYQSKIKNRKYYDEIINLLKGYKLEYTNHPATSLGDEVQQIRLNAESSRKIHQWFRTRENVHFIPEYLLNLSARQSKLFLETYLRGDGKENCKIATSDLGLLDDLERIIVNAGYGFTVRRQKPIPGTVGKKDIYILRIIRHPETYITKIKRINYEGIIWCPQTENGTIIARRKGKVFITGNCPFSNLTLDLRPSPVFAKLPIIIGGKPQKETYGEFEEEMKIFNRAFYEAMLEGDKFGRSFSFPIPTINITRDFPWDEPAFDGIFETSAKYGINYFANYINSDMKPEEARAMCLDGNEEILIRNSKRIKRAPIKEIAENYKVKEFDKEGWADCRKTGKLEVLSLNPETLKLEWSPVKRFLKILDSKGVEITTEDGKEAIFSLKHPVPVYTPEGIKMKFAKDIQKGDYLLVLKRVNDNILSKEYQKIEDLILEENLAKILGYFVADGNYLFENRKGYTHYGEPRGIQFSFKTGDFENLNTIKSLIKKTFGLKSKEKQDPRYNTYYLYVYNSNLARKLYNAGFKKCGRLPQILFDSPANVIKNFLALYFKGDGYEKRREIHLNDLELSRDLVLLLSLIGQPVTYRLKKRSQVIYLQHSKSKLKRNSRWMNNPILAERIPGWMAVSTTKVPGLRKSRMVGFNTLEKYNAHTNESLKIKNSDIYLVRAKETRIRNYNQIREFYDLELEKNHLFVHSLGQITFNCCRLKLDLRELYNRGGGGLFGSGANTGSISVITVNLPRIGYLSKTKKEFFERLGKVMDLAKEVLEIKRKVLENLIEKGLYPYSKVYLEGVKKMRGSYYGNHFSTIGLVGMNEALLNFIGENIASKRGRRFALEVLDFMRERLVKYQKETGNLYNLEATPAESCAYRLCLKDKEKYPNIITAGTKKVPFYTNSSQLPVNYTDDIFEALKLQDELQTKYTGGCIERGNKVLTDKGLFPIEFIVENFEKLKPIKALSYNKEKGISEWDEIIKAVSIDVKKYNKIRIKGERNLDITTSDWHPFFVLEKIKPNPTCPVCEEKLGAIKAFPAHLRYHPECRKRYKLLPKYRVIEKRADELKVGDYILQNFHNLYPEISPELNSDLMWLIGFFIGDGCISEFIDNRGGNNLKKYKVRFSGEHLEALEKAKEIVSKYFGVKAKVIKNDKRSEPERELTTSKREVSEFFFKYGFKPGEKVYDVCIPQKVKENLNKNNIFAFLSGLMDSDGTISKRDGDFEYQSVSPKLAEDILEICVKAGIMISKSLKKTKRKNEVNIWRLRIPAYQLTMIKDKLEVTVNPKLIKEKISNRKKRHLPVVRVKNVSKIDVKDNQFYDLMTKKNHNYLAGKNCLVFIHNTVLHLFLGERISDIQTVKNLIKKIFENFKLPYITLTPTFCYDEKTEILTENGWKRFSELKEGEKVLTANPETKELSYQEPLRRFKFPYQGIMIHFKSKAFDCMVTPDHRMFVSGKKVIMRDPKTGKFIKSTKIYYFVKAKDISSIDKVPMTGYKWKGKMQEFFILPSVINNKTILTTEIKKLLNEYENKTQAEIAALVNCSPSFVSMVKNRKRGIVENYSAIKIPMSNWLKFFGIWIAEGSVRGSKGGDAAYKPEIVITQKKHGKTRDEIREMLKELPFKFSESSQGFHIHNKQLWHYLTQFGNSRTKYIPQELKMLPPKMLRLFLEWYLKGDGIKGTNYCSSFSKRLRDDLQEIYLKIGFDASILDNKGIVTKRTHKYTYLKEIQHKVKYSGYVYCVEVPNHVIYVRRNNKPNFSGNSICPSHGYLEGEHFECPRCPIRQPCEVYSRIVGYLRPISQWNLGKQQEFRQRKEFKIPKTL